VPLDFRVSLLDANNKRAVHSSKGVGEPPFVVSSSVFFAVRNAVRASREQQFETSGKSYGVGDEMAPYFVFNLPATSERIRMGCIDSIVSVATGSAMESFQPKGSW
jgi:xanthine dehydrogenase/oxidase